MLWALTHPQNASEDSDQTAWMRRLVCVLAGRKCNIVGNAVPRLICIFVVHDIDQCFTYQIFSDNSVNNDIVLRGNNF